MPKDNPARDFKASGAMRKAMRKCARGFGPGWVLLFVEALTTNRNRNRHLVRVRFFKPAAIFSAPRARSLGFAPGVA